MDTTFELAPETWSRYFDEVGTELLNADVSIEVIAAGERQFEVADARGSAHLPSVVRHLVDHPERIAVDSTAMAPTKITVDDRDGVRTVVTIERSAAFAG